MIVGNATRACSNCWGCLPKALYRWTRRSVETSSDDRSRFADAVARACDPDGGGRLQEDVRILWPDGSSLAASFCAGPFYRRSRRPLRMVGAAVDATEREQAKEALRISQERQAFLLTLSDAIRPIADPAAIQREAATLLGQRLRASRVHYGEVSEDGAWGMVRQDYCNGVASVVGKHHLDSYGPLVMAEFRAGRTLVIDDVGAEERLTQQERLATQALDIGAYAIAPLLKGGRLVALFVASISRRRIDGRNPSFRLSRRSESAPGPRSSGRWLRNASRLRTNASPRRSAPRRSPPSSRTETFATSGSNPALGYRAEDMVGKTDLDLFEREEDARALIAVKQRALDTGAQAREEVRVLSAGVMRWYDLIVEPRRSGEAIVGLLCTATDITEHKQTEAALTEANRREREFLAVLGHELRNPLASIEHGVQLLTSTEKAAERQTARGAIEVMARQAEHLGRLADDLLDISRIDQDKIDIRRERVDVALALRDAVEALRPQIEEKGQQFEASVSPEPVRVVGDRTRIAQIVANLIGNAIKYTGPDGVIRVNLEPQDQSAVLTVRDSGVGIAPEVLPRVFDLFMQADRTDQRGLGIGLALSKKLVELHGGAIEAQSAGLGKGSAFVVRLPLDQASVATAVHDIGVLRPD